MHPSSPHAPTRLAKTARIATSYGPAPARGKGRISAADDPLVALSKEIHGKLVAGSSAAKAHVAAEELTLRRPRRPSARRASFRVPPASR